MCIRTQKKNSASKVNFSLPFAFVFVAAEILDEIAKAKFTDPTPIQVRKVQFHPPKCGCYQAPNASINRESNTFIV